MPLILLSSVCITFAPKGYHEPPEGPDTILTNWSAFAIVATILIEDTRAKVFKNFFIIISSKIFYLYSSLIISD